MRLALNAMEAHPCDDGADKVDVKYRINVDQVKDHGRGQKAEARKCRHLLAQKRRVELEKGSVCECAVCHFVLYFVQLVVTAP